MTESKASRIIIDKKLQLRTAILYWNPLTLIERRIILDNFDLYEELMNQENQYMPQWIIACLLSNEWKFLVLNF